MRNSEALSVISQVLHCDEEGTQDITDFKSRYFTADYPYGLKVLIDLGELIGLDISSMRKIWQWYKDI